VLGWQLYCHPFLSAEILSGRQYNCHPNLMYANVVQIGDWSRLLKSHILKLNVWATKRQRRVPMGSQAV